MLDFWTSFYHRKFATKLCFNFAVILVSKKRYNNVNKRITIFIFADYLSSCYESQALHLYAIIAFKISSYYLIKVCFFCFGLFFVCFFFSKEGLLMHDLRGITFCPSINLEQPVMVLVIFFSYVSAKLRNALPDFIRT